MSRIILLFSIILITFLSCAKKTSKKDDKSARLQKNEKVVFSETYDKNKRWVAEKEGLYLFNDNSTLDSSHAQFILPFLSEAEVIEETGDIFLHDDEYGKWTKVKWKDNEGWAFGGMLKNYDLSRLIENLDIQELADPEKEIYQKITSDNIKSVKGNFVLLEYASSGLAIGDSSIAGALYHYKNGSWTEIFHENFTGTELFYLNSDQYPDYIQESGCCGHHSLDVYYGDSTGFQNIQSLDNVTFGGEYYLISTGTGDKTAIQDYCTKEIYKFSLEQNKFIINEKSSHSNNLM